MNFTIFQNGLGVIVGLFAVGMAPAAETPRRPNILLFLADDIGISGISCYGSESFKTPHIDKLAADGIRFDYGFSHPVCGPSRVCLMTGRYPFRTGGLGNRSSQRVSPRDQTPVSLVLQQAGYATSSSAITAL